ncbi:MAG: LytTR family transcriptional regulator [Saprospiraceae bacterium]|nr:LytTR family transcriptional regulator [Saprospiraceae bacterium]
MKAPPDNPGKTVAFPVKNGYRIARCADIVRCEAAGNYTMVFLANGQDFSLCKRLKEVEGMLPATVFCRVHQSHLVNLGWVELWVREGLLLAGGAMVPVAKSKRRAEKVYLFITEKQIL